VNKRLWPGVFQRVFPPASLGTLRMLSQIGVCLFMFVIGMELDVTQLKQQVRTAVFVSQVSILFPYLLGVLSALWLFPSLASPGTTFLAFALFIGISMSITAFPVLARILEERGLTASFGIPCASGSNTSVPSSSCRSSLPSRACARKSACSRSPPDGSSASA